MGPPGMMRPMVPPQQTRYFNQPGMQQHSMPQPGAGAPRPPVPAPMSEAQQQQLLEEKVGIDHE